MSKKQMDWIPYLRIPLLFLILSILMVKSDYSFVEAKESKDSEEVRAVWVSCFDFESAGLSNQPEGTFRANAAALFANIKNNGCNTVYFHVRSHNDAIYPSKTFKWSKQMFRKGTPKYDPLKILIEESHKQDVAFHAWINPYRISSNKILNPAKKATINRIVKGVKEIIKKYDVDGIHFDDYFYPGKSHKQYKKYKSVSVKRKKDNVNKMIRSVYKCIKNYDKDVSFGISPAGDTSYCKVIGADVKTWLSKKGYVDYVVPQLYWTNQYKQNGKKTTLFNKRLAEWNSMNKNKVPMYIGLALYRCGSKNSLDPGWKKKSTNITDQIKLLRIAGNEGYSLFSYQSLFAKQTKKEMSNYRKYIVAP